MADQPALGFGGLLRQLRVQAKLTQEVLAEAAGLSPRSVSDLERGSTGRPARTPLMPMPVSLAALPTLRRMASARHHR